jgi:hypothetical protein
VITDRHPLEGYKLGGLDPFVHKVLNPSAESLYLQSDTHYPTVVLDLDGNERAAIQLRSNAWNVAQILLQQANRSATPRNVKAACRAELARWAEAERARWAPRRAGLLSDVSVLERNIPSEEGRTSKDLEVRRVAIRAAAERTEAHDYHEYVAAVDRFLAMPRNASDALVPKESLGTGQQRVGSAALRGRPGRAGHRADARGPHRHGPQLSTCRLLCRIARHSRAESGTERHWQ